MNGKSCVITSLVLLVVAGVGAYLAWRLSAPSVPAIATEGMDAEVVALINEARAEVAARPRSAAAWGRLGMVLFGNTMYGDSIAVLAQAEQLDPRDPRWPYLAGLALILQKPEEGLAALKRAAAIPGPNLHIRMRLAEESLKQDRLDEADTLYQGILAETPGFPWALVGQGQILLKRGQYEAATEPLEQAALDRRAQSAARTALAEAYQRQGKVAEAETERKRAKALPPDTKWEDPILDRTDDLHTGLQFRVDQALGVMQGGDVGRARTLIADVVRDHPDSDDAHLAMAKVLIRSGAFDEAVTQLQRALTINPDLVQAHVLLASIQMTRKDFAAAEKSCRRAIELQPAFGEAHHDLGICLLQLGNRAGALQAFRDALRARPDLAIAHVELGALLLEDGQVQEAIAHLDQAVRLDGQNERARTLLEKARQARDR
jgi:tetratricopeptide (TPR) repeat protein